MKASFWEARFKELQACKAEHGDCNDPRKYRDNQKLARWVRNQRKRRADLTPDQRRRLNELGFDWDPKASFWETRFKELQAYKGKHGDCSIPQKYPENQQLASWVHNLRSKRGELCPDRVRRLDELGFDWDPKASFWEARFKELRACKAEHGDCNNPTKYRHNKKLAKWVRNQRGKRKELSLDRVRRLDDLGFDWDPKASFWEARFKELAAYKAKRGDCSVPRKYSENQRLANWVRNLQRKHIKLSADQLQRLDELGFDWGRSKSKQTVV